MFFNTPWTRLSDSQKQGRTRGMHTNSLRPTASEYFIIGPTRIGGPASVKKRHLSLYIREKSQNEERDLDSYGYRTTRFIKINGKEIF